MFRRKGPEALKDELEKREAERLPGETSISNPPLGLDPVGRNIVDLVLAEEEAKEEASGATSDTIGPRIENTLGTVHIKKPSFERVFFLLRPLLKPVQEQFNRVEQQIAELVKLLTMERVFIDKLAIISSNAAYEVNFLGHKFLYLYTTQPLTLVITPGSQTIAAGASVWTPLVFPAGTKITASGVSDQNPVGVTIRACDVPMVVFAELIASGTSSTIPQQITANINTGNNVIGTAGVAYLNPGGATLETVHDNWDNQTAFASGTIAIGSTTYGPFTNANATGVMVFLNITAITTGTIILHIQGKDPVTNAVVDLLIDANAITTNNGLYTFIVNVGSTVITSTSGVAPGAGALRTVVNQQLPRTWQITAVVATAAITASISYGYLL